jgi:hypothetical protein
MMKRVIDWTETDIVDELLRLCALNRGNGGNHDQQMAFIQAVMELGDQAEWLREWHAMTDEQRHEIMTRSGITD